MNRGLDATPDRPAGAGSIPGDRRGAEPEVEPAAGRWTTHPLTEARGVSPGGPSGRAAKLADDQASRLETDLSIDFRVLALSDVLSRPGSTVGERVRAIATAVNCASPSVIPLLARAATIVRSQEERAAALDALALRTSSALRDVELAIKIAGVDLARNISQDPPFNVVSLASLRLARELGDRSPVVCRAAEGVATNFEAPSLHRSEALRLLQKAKGGQPLVSQLASIATSERCTADQRVGAVMAIGAMATEPLIGAVVHKLSAIASAVPARPSSHTADGAFGAARETETIRVGCQAVKELLALATPQSIEMVTAQLGHVNREFRNRVLQLLLDAARSGTDITAPVLRWMDASRDFALGCRLLQQVNDSVLVPIFLRELARGNGRDAPLLDACVKGLQRNAEHISRSHVPELCRLMSSPSIAVADAATRVYGVVAIKFPQGLVECRRNLQRPGCSESLARSAIAALSAVGRPEDGAFLSSLLSVSGPANLTVRTVISSSSFAARPRRLLG